MTGSFNFAPSVETKNSENVVAIRDMPDDAARFLSHWQSHWDGAVPIAATDIAQGAVQPMSHGPDGP